MPAALERMATLLSTPRLAALRQGCLRPQPAIRRYLDVLHRSGLLHHGKADRAACCPVRAGTLASPGADRAWLRAVAQLAAA